MAETQNDFSETMTRILNCGALNLAMGIGYRLGIFDVMDQFEHPESAAVVANAAGLDLRYIQEWLGVMATGGIVEISQNSNNKELFYLPKAHGDLLARRAGNANIGVYTQEIPLLTVSAMEAVLEGFQTGEGASYDRYSEFQSFMGELADAKHREVLIRDFLPSVNDGKIIRMLQSGIRVCDIGCGEGCAILLMAKAYPKSHFVGIDMSEKAIEKAETDRQSSGIANLEFFCRDAAALAEDGRFMLSFDYVTAFDAIHDQRHPLAALKNIFHILKPGGFFSMVDIAAASRVSENIAHPMGAFLYTVSLMHCMPVGLFSGGRGLGMMWGREKAEALLGQAGFHQIQVLEIPEDSFNVHYFCTKGDM